MICTTLVSPADYTVEKSESGTPTLDGPHAEVIYQGVSGGEVKLAYREFPSRRARPALIHDLSYQLLAYGPTAIGGNGYNSPLKTTSRPSSSAFSTTLRTLRR